MQVTGFLLLIAMIGVIALSKKIYTDGGKMIGLEQYIIVSSLLFSIGFFGFFYGRILW